MFASLNKFFSKFGKAAKNVYRVYQVMTRGFDAAKETNLLNDWPGTSESIDNELVSALPKLRMRSRDFEQNNGHAKRFLGQVEDNVIGDEGVLLQSNVEDERGESVEKVDEVLENEFWKWGKDYCTVSGLFSWPMLQRAGIRAVARDGEFLCRIVRNFPNPYGFALQPLEAEYLDENKNQDPVNGKRKIRLGVEYDEWGRPIAYHLKRNMNAYGMFSGQTQVIPAEDIIHIFVPFRFEQSRGIPWMAQTMRKMKMLDGYEYAEVVAARAASCKMGVYEQSAEAQGDLSDTIADGKQDDGKLIEEFAPGVFGKLPPGYKLNLLDPTHPSGNYEQFSKTMLKSIAAGLEVAYHGLTGDLTSVNYSSIRAGVITERDTWKKLQNFIVWKLHCRVYYEWLKVALLAKVRGIPYDPEKYYDASNFVARRWEWVDPLKDVTAKVMERDNLLTSFSAIMGEQGKDFFSNVKALRKELDAIKAAGIDFPLTKKKEVTLGKEPEKTEPDEDEGKPSGPESSPERT